MGAGYGFLSLAAAARGHKVHAFELAPASLEAFEASIGYNGFGHLIEVHKLPLGAPHQEEYICIVPRQKPAAVSSGTWGGNSNEAAAAAAYTELLRGYSTPEVGRTLLECASCGRALLECASFRVPLGVQYLGDARCPAAYQAPRNRAYCITAATSVRVRKAAACLACLSVAHLPAMLCVVCYMDVTACVPLPQTLYLS